MRLWMSETLDAHAEPNFWVFCTSWWENGRLPNKSTSPFSNNMEKVFNFLRQMFRKYGVPESPILPYIKATLVPVKPVSQPDSVRAAHSQSARLQVVVKHQFLRRQDSLAEELKGHKGNNPTFCDCWDALNVNLSTSVVRNSLQKGCIMVHLVSHWY